MDYTERWINQLYYPHHRQSVLNLRDELIKDPAIQAVILGGSICHGYARADSDIDCMILVDIAECECRRRENRIQYFTTALTPYEGGYVDGKYQSMEYVRIVADRGAEPARFAYKDAKIVFSRIDGLENLLECAAAYPEEGREQRIKRFHAQLDGMRWFFGEGAKRGDAFTIRWSSVNMVLFGCRMLLAHNHVLFPCQKTMTHELARCAELPGGIFAKIDDLLLRPTQDSAEAFYRAVKDWRVWEQSSEGWSNQFMADAELKWLTGEASVAEI